MSSSYRAKQNPARTGKKSDPQPEENDMPCKELIKHALSSTTFDTCVCLIIFANAITIGLEQSFRIQRMESTWLRIVEHMFLVIYVLELGARVYAHGLTCFKDNWVKFDAFLVATGILYAWILEPLSEDVQRLNLLIVLRLVRLLRLARIFRLLAQFRELYTLVRAVANCFSTICYTLAFLFMSLYVFSCVGLEIISNHELASTPEFKAHVDSHFKNLPMTMFTLIRFVCLDDMSEAYVSLVAQDWTLAIYFVTVILVVGIVFMNLLAAAVINSCMEQSSVDRDSLRQDEERRRQRLIHELKRLFHRIDVDGSGQISKAEIKSVALPDKSFLLSAMSTTNLMEVFSRLDVDSSGSVDIDEFVDGMEVAMSNAPIHLKRLEAKINIALAQLRQHDSDRQHMVAKYEAMLSAGQLSTGAESQHKDLASIDQSEHAVPPDQSRDLVPTDQSEHLVATDQSAHLVPNDLPPWVNELSKQLSSQTQAINESIRKLHSNLRSVCHQASGNFDVQPHQMTVKQPPSCDGSVGTYMHLHRQDEFPAICTLEHENMALREQLRAADAALLNVLQRTRSERLKSAPATHADPDVPMIEAATTSTASVETTSPLKFQQL